MAVYELIEAIYNLIKAIIVGSDADTADDFAAIDAAIEKLKAGF